ncbi:MAG: hypothetical protein P1R58_09775 [bacterium]|nr:hypothetical protein [bacterium]
MGSIKMKFLYKATVSALIALTLALSAAAGEYVSLNGKFRFTYPDDWEQMDYSTVDAFLYNNRASDESFNYEAVFSPKSNSPFHKGDYLILTLDKIGALDSTQTDSLMNSLGRVFGNRVKYYPQSSYIANLKSNTPYFDRANRVAKIINDVSESNDPFKKNLLVYKFYDEGIAKFFFYSPDSLFENSRPVFEQMVATFSTENIDEALPKEEVKIADIDTDKDEDKGIFGLPIAVFAALVVVFIVIMRKKRAARARSK